MDSDRGAWVEQLAECHGRAVFHAAYRVLGDAEDAEDALQDVFLKLLQGKMRRDSVSEWGAYLRVTGARAAIDLLRRKKKRHWAPLETIEDLPAPVEQQPWEVIDQRQRAAQLREALRKLPQREATIFALRYFEELPYERIAKQLGISSNQVGVALHRARKRLTAILKPEVQRPRPEEETRHVESIQESQ